MGGRAPGAPPPRSANDLGSWADPLPGYYGIRSMSGWYTYLSTSGRYTSYWNAFLLLMGYTVDLHVVDSPENVFLVPLFYLYLHQLEPLVVQSLVFSWNILSKDKSAI